jgi:hypothetical protein
MFLTSLAFLVASAVLLVAGAIEGSVTLLAISLGCGVGGALSLAAAYALGPRLARAAGIGTAAEPTGPQPMGAALGGNGLGAPNGKVNGASSTWAIDAAPIPSYDEMTGTQVVAVVQTGALARPALAAILAYEAAHKGRKTVVTALERALGVGAGAR